MTNSLGGAVCHLPSSPTNFVLVFGHLMDVYLSVTANPPSLRPSFHPSFCILVYHSAVQLMPIRILSLPAADLQYALSSMNTKDLIALSLCSKRTKSLVKASNREIEGIVADVHKNRIRVRIGTSRLEENDQHQFEYGIEFLNISDSQIELGGNGKEVKFWRKQEFTRSDWIPHFLSIFHESMIHQLDIKNVSLSYLDTIKQIIPKFCHSSAKLMTIRILSLPVTDLLYALKYMDLGDLIAFSLCSKQTKNLVKSSNRKIESINAKVDENRIRVRIVTKRYHKHHTDSDHQNYGFVSFDVFDSDSGNRFESKVRWKQELTQSDRIAHFLSIFNESVIHKLIIENVNLSYLDTVKQLIPKCQTLKITGLCSDDVARIAFSKLSHIAAEELEIYKNTGGPILIERLQK
ncbi:hypothetical protein B9Z55_029129 [Caenorhabditis nigoni]|uniref:F-box domain-containing protein n=1 Tax=Caenorhabditis nigoni TaxID=1611254 RepID=A0A2G5S8Z3_9PELO|nr:hypothetical protein B9Z55_029129 [Caenorhabditis nigoni]